MTARGIQASEWILSFSLLLILASLFTLSRFHEHRKKNQLIAYADPENLIEIIITGEVLHPGTFSVVPGTRIGDLVKKSHPKRFANLCAMDLDRPVEKPLTLSIPRLDEITIRVDGAVPAPIELTIPAGSRICDLKGKIECKGDADFRFFRKRRLLKNGETLVIPCKANEENQQALD